MNIKVALSRKCYGEHDIFSAKKYVFKWKYQFQAQ